MNIHFFEEPELQFGAGKHIDIKFGLKNYGPLDFDSTLAPKRIKVGIVGTPEAVEGVQAWLETCAKGIPAKPSKQPNLFPEFPGFSPDVTFRSSLLLEPRLQRTIQRRELEKLSSNSDHSRIVQDAVELFLRELTYLKENTDPDVVICIIPVDALPVLDKGDEEEGRTEAEGTKPRATNRLDFHNLLKAKALPLGKPLQLTRPSTYDESKLTRRRGGLRKLERIQDKATRAWNFHTALYYKAGGTPWRLLRSPSELTACYVGISFYMSLDASTMLTSSAQVFNERGEGVVVRGGAAKISKEDRQAHLSADDAYALLSQALTAYKTEHFTSPARVVLHKTSTYSPDELAGFMRAIEERDIHFADLISVRQSYTRLFRNGTYAPLRGTFLSLSADTHILYTKGSVDFFATQPFLYVPTTLEFRCERADQTPRFLAEEMLALTKMSWNNTQFDRFYPVTVRVARDVGDILKYIDDNAVVEPRYKFYM